MQPLAGKDMGAALARLDPGEVVVSDRLIERPEFFETSLDWKDRLTPLPASRFDSRNGQRRPRPCHGRIGAESGIPPPGVRAGRRLSIGVASGLRRRRTAAAAHPGIWRLADSFLPKQIRYRRSSRVEFVALVAEPAGAVGFQCAVPSTVGPGFLWLLECNLHLRLDAVVVAAASAQRGAFPGRPVALHRLQDGQRTFASCPRESLVSSWRYAAPLSILGLAASRIPGLCRGPWLPGAVQLERWGFQWGEGAAFERLLGRERDNLDAVIAEHDHTFGRRAKQAFHTT